MSRGFRDMGTTNQCARDIFRPKKCSRRSLITDASKRIAYAFAMASGLERFYGSADLHFITASCYRRQPLLGSAWRRELFVQALEQVRQRYQFVLVAYVVMPEHFHLLISEPERANPSVVIQALKLGVARRIVAAQKRRDRRNCRQPSLLQDLPSSRVWQARFYDYNVWSGRKRTEKMRYIHRNSVRRGLVETPDQWRWSSFRAYAYGETGLVRVNDWSVLKLKIRSVAS